MSDFSLLSALAGNSASIFLYSKLGVFQEKFQARSYSRERKKGRGWKSRMPSCSFSSFSFSHLLPGLLLRRLTSVTSERQPWKQSFQKVPLLVSFSSCYIRRSEFQSNRTGEEFLFPEKPRAHYLFYIIIIS